MGSAMVPLDRAFVSSYVAVNRNHVLSAAVWPQFETQVSGAVLEIYVTSLSYVNK